MAEALVLNASYEPLCVVSQRRAVVLVLTDKAVALERGPGVVRSATAALDVPAVVRLLRFVRVPYRATVPLTRKAVFARDGGRCVYCSAAATSLDHVVPRSRGGPHTWDNVVSACRRCNHVKADRVLADLGWRLHVTPRAPSGTAWRVVGARPVQPAWRAYLGHDHSGYGAPGHGHGSSGHGSSGHGSSGHGSSGHGSSGHGRGHTGPGLDAAAATA